MSLSPGWSDPMPVAEPTPDELPRYLADDEPLTCPHCGRLVDEDGITVDPYGCCFYCKGD